MFLLGENQTCWARSIQLKFPEISVQNSMDRFGPTRKVSKKQVHLLRWSTFPGRTGWNFGGMDRARCVTKMLKFGDGVRWMFTCKVGSCLSTWSVFDQQSIHRKRLRRIHGIVKLQRIIIKIKCAVSERDLLLKIEKNKRWEERADQSFKQLNLWRDSLL